MKKQFWIIILTVMLLPSFGQAQFMIATMNDDKNIETTDSQESDSVGLDTLGNQEKVQKRNSRGRRRISREQKKIGQERAKQKVSTFNENEPYKMFGITALTPGGINLICGYQGDIGGIRITGGYAKFIAGIQVNALLNFGKSENMEHNVSIGAGVSSLDVWFVETNAWFQTATKGSLSWKYVGLFYDFNFYGFFGEVGVVGGSDNYDFFDPWQIFAQVGYVWRFN